MPPAIPVEVTDITCEWLAAALEERAPGAVLRGITIVEAHSGTTGRARVALAHDDPRLPSSIFVKLAPFDVDQRGFVTEQGMGVAEARFYSEIAPDVPVRHPRPWHASHDDDGRYVMVLEDLLGAGARYPRPDDSEIVAFAADVIDSFAALHAAFWASPRFEAGGDLAWVERRTRGYGSAAPLVEFAVGQIGERMPGAFHRLAGVYLPRAEGVATLIARGSRTLVHGDAHLGNMFVAGTTPGLLDWAMVGCAPGLRDVAYFLGSSVPTPLRRTHERGLVTRYCDGLAARGIALGADEAWEEYRLQMVTSWIAAVVTAAMGSRWQPLAVGMGAARRANAAIEDLDVAGLLTSLLG